MDSVFSSESALANTLHECVINHIPDKDGIKMVDFIIHNEELGRELISSIADAIFWGYGAISNFVEDYVPKYAKHYLGERGTAKQLLKIVKSILKAYISVNRFKKGGDVLLLVEICDYASHKDILAQDDVFIIGCMGLMRLQLYKTSSNNIDKENSLYDVVKTLLNGGTKEEVFAVTRAILETGKADKVMNLCGNLVSYLGELNSLIYNVSRECGYGMNVTTSVDIRSVVSVGLKTEFNSSVGRPMENIVIARVKGFSDDVMEDTLKKGVEFYVRYISDLVMWFIKP